MSVLGRMFVPGTAAVVSGLAVTQTVGYGALFYSFSIMSAELSAAFGWSRSFVFGIFSVGLLASGLMAPFVGSLLDRVGARNPMTLGSLLAGVGLAMMAMARGQVSFVIAAVFIELVSAFVLYEAAFIAVTQAAGSRARLGITQITLVAGFASTIFWPLIVWLLSFLDWRHVYLVLAAMQVAICAPIHWIALARSPRPAIGGTSPAGTEAEAVAILPAPPPHAMLLLGISFCGGAVAITATQIHLLGILAGFGFDAAEAAALGALVGPFQVGARLAEMVFGRRRSPLFTGLVSTSLLAFGLACLLLAGTSQLAALSFAVFYGAGQGLTFIIRGAIPLFLFGPDGYGRITGRLNSARLILSATAPFGFAWVADRSGEPAALAILVACAALAMASLAMLLTMTSRQRAAIS